MKRRTAATAAVLMLVMLMLMLSGCSGAKKIPENEGILGKWYECSGGTMETVVFYDDGTLVRTLEEFSDDEDLDYTPFVYDEESGILEFTTFEDTAYVTVEETVMEYSMVEYEETHVLYRDRDEAEANDPYYLTSDEFTDTIMDDEGFCIRDGVLYAYRGEAEEITVPDGVKVIYMEAFAGDFNHGVNLKKVTVPGSVMEIKSNAFAFTNADCIIIEEGVEKIGSYAFMDSYIKEIHFPSSLTEIGDAIMETEEGLDGTKIYVPEGSEIERYFEKSKPYGETEIIKE